MVGGRLVAGRYALERPMGRDRRGEIWLAADTEATRPVALRMLENGDELAVAAHDAARLRGLDHPNLIRLLDAGRDGTNAYLVLDYVEGETLEARLERGRHHPKRLSESAADSIPDDRTSQLASGRDAEAGRREVGP